jgi:hypothetical protein
MTGLVPVIHAVQLPASLGASGGPTTWMAGTSPAMTESGVARRNRGAVFAPDYWFFSDWFMISRASKLMPQVGKELPTKKLSDRVE